MKLRRISFVFIFVVLVLGLTNLVGVSATAGAAPASAVGISLPALYSVGAQDGWILESAQTSNKGGRLNSSGMSLLLGDDGQKRQYRSILSFNTAGLPENAIIGSVKLTLHRQSVTGTGNPFKLFQGLLVDVRSGYFGTAALQTTDFQAAASKGALGPYMPVPVNGAYTISLSSTAFPSINRNGTTQLRLRFKLDDNNDLAANTISFYSGNYANAAYRPKLVIVYSLPTNTPRPTASVTGTATLTVTPTPTLTATATLTSAQKLLDPTFGIGGTVTTDFGGDDQAYGVALQADGKIVVAGETSADCELARYNTDGGLDTGFGSGGTVSTDFGGNDAGMAVTVQADGKIVVAGDSFDGNNRSNFVLARYDSDGNLDTAFGTDGKVNTDFGLSDYVSAVVVQADGKIVVAGSSLHDNNVGDFALARYYSDGILDTGFGSVGLVTTDFGGKDDDNAVALQADGRIVLVGTTRDSDYKSNLALARYNSDGSLDTDFGIGCKVTTDLGGNEYGYAAALQADGKIVVAGAFEDSDYKSDFVVARYNSAGSLDTSFGIGGRVMTDLGGNDYVSAVTLQPDGQIVAAGASFDASYTGNFVLARYGSDGSLDTGFGTGGTVNIDFGHDEYADGAVLQPDGKIVVVGISSGNFELARYLLP